MNGAQILLDTLVDSGVEVVFANPGTSEMQLVSAIGDSDRMRAVLCLFEGVASGAADGYARMLDKPAATLLHLGCGFSNSMANLHNARRAQVPIVNIVGDHATHHLKFDAPLTSDLPAHADISSGWVAVSESAQDLGACAARAVQASLRGWGQIATLITPANHTWEEAGPPAAALAVPEQEAIGEDSVMRAARALGNGKETALFLGGRALREESLEAAGRIARASGARILCETFPARLQRGAGRVAVERLPYFAEKASEFLSSFDQIILVAAKEPVSFFAYPGLDGRLTPKGCDLIVLAEAGQDVLAGLQGLARAIGARQPGETVRRGPPRSTPSGALTPAAMGQSLQQLLPEDAIVSDEAATCGLPMMALTEDAASHDWLTLTGGAIGQGLPLSLGAAIACPDRKVVALQADGSAMYTVQALWSMARENTDVTVVIMNNRSYAILNIELARVGAGQATPKTLSLFDLSNPDIDWVKIARGMGVAAVRAESAEAFHLHLAEAMRHRGPRLIEAVVAQKMP
jgi:acetolactate synthase-1/2/3 large subunit